jgi:hypothetical protein
MKKTYSCLPYASFVLLLLTDTISATFKVGVVLGDMSLFLPGSISRTIAEHHATTNGMYACGAFHCKPPKRATNSNTPTLCLARIKKKAGHHSDFSMQRSHTHCETKEAWYNREKKHDLDPKKIMISLVLAAVY